MFCHPDNFILGKFSNCPPMKHSFRLTQITSESMKKIQYSCLRAFIFLTKCTIDFARVPLNTYITNTFQKITEPIIDCLLILQIKRLFLLSVSICASVVFPSCRSLFFVQFLNLYRGTDKPLFFWVCVCFCLFFFSSKTQLKFDVSVPLYIE